jgi:hypothetical protein
VSAENIWEGTAGTRRHTNHVPAQRRAPCGMPAIRTDGTRLTGIPQQSSPGDLVARPLPAHRQDLRGCRENLFHVFQTLQTCTPHGVGLEHFRDKRCSKAVPLAQTNPDAAVESAHGAGIEPTYSTTNSWPTPRATGHAGRVYSRSSVDGREEESSPGISGEPERNGR